MAASSPAATKSTTDTTTTTATTGTAATAAAAAATPSPPSLPFQRMDTPPKTQRGLNKPKCIQCGNVARSSRCPYRSCKSCCSKAQNPCHIHVLKSNSAYPEKTPTSSTPSSDQKSTQASSQATPLRVPSFRQLSNAFAQFDNLQVRSKKHLTIKDAVALNEWRFSKLKEFKDRNIEVENEAFDRYMQNISLLEEVFSTKSIHKGSNEDEGSEPKPSSLEDETWMMTSGLKLTLRSDPVRTDDSRKRIQQIVDQGIKKLQKCEADDGANDPDDQNKHGSRLNKVKTLWVERASILSDFVDKLNKARSEEDLKSCLDMKARLYNQSIEEADRNVAETKHPEALNKQGAENDVTPRRVADYLLPKLFTPIEIDQETINKVDVHFSSLEQIEDL
ncbi:Uncharacterized protein TCM_045300 isoform 2 [Theobroma cacao]|uniref:Uncharacterized protein isoform 2 n=1 Tax=Theobroma cacao TaxID=3641 RepID=A0A061FSL4_THECC|nr:Uncharacterized protein TCM_045300 isoform 2 [Theobroma cacao]